MSIDFKLSTLLGTVYRQGNLLFTPDGTCILSPVGNRVSLFDLVNNKSFTFAYEHRKNIARIALNPQATLMLSIDNDGRAILVNFVRRTVIHHFNFKDRVLDVKFAPDGQHFAVAAGRHIQVWRTPGASEQKQFAPFIRHRIYTGHFAEVTSITWSGDSRFFLTSSKDLTARVYSLNSRDSAAATTLAGHRDAVVGAFFSSDQESIYTVSKDGALFQWKYVPRNFEAEPNEDEEDEKMEEEREKTMRWRIVSKHYFMQEAKVKCAAFHEQSNLLVVGFASGIFGLYELPDFVTIQTLSISQNEIDFVTINKTGEWLGFGAAKLGQLLVWEWQSESYILKQQGHFDSLNALVYSPDGTKIVTGGDDGKIKVWDAISGFAIVTFTEHQSAVTDLHFTKRGNVLFSASLDGSVRAWDLVRYRNFRTYTAPKRVQFTSLAVDPSGEVVCAGSLDDFDIHLWSVQTAQLLDRLSGHTGPVSSLCFGGENGVLASASWDRTVRVWNIFGRQTHVEPLQLQSDVTRVVMRPDSKQIAVSTTDGQITLWDPELGKQVGTIDGKEDIAGGRHMADQFTAASSKRSRHFTNLCYSSDGSILLAGGNSKHICLYDVGNEVLLRKFVISRNMALDGTLDKFNSKNMTEAGPLELIDTTGEASDLEDRIDNSLPGAQRGDASARKVRPAIRSTGIQFSPTNRSFGVASTEGLLVYSIDDELVFDPFDLDIDITVSSTMEKLAEQEFLTALVMAFRLGERKLIHRVYESVPLGDVSLVAKDLPVVYLERLLRFIGSLTDDSPHVEYHLLWIQSLLTSHGRYVTKNRRDFGNALRSLQKFVTRLNKEVSRLSSSNLFTLQYLLSNQAGEADGIDGAAAMDVDKDVSEESGASEDEEMDEDEEGWFGPESKVDSLPDGKEADSDDSDDSDDE
ncbi:periodic tryptophan protein 2 [Trichomonascus vanleenenianus]|uniref:snoRNA-binding rRNA-processing protein PWP2 n=1 Tax=Trichomonascus vanleenenianus TaxID=2268995 RepID=UPI003ECA1982